MCELKENVTTPKESLLYYCSVYTKSKLDISMTRELAKLEKGVDRRLISFKLVVSWPFVPSVPQCSIIA